MRKGAKRVVSALAFMLAGLGCSVIVGNDVPDFACSVDAVGVCPSGLHCDVVAKKCVATDGSTPIDEPADNDATDGPITTETGVDVDAPTGPYDLGSQCRLDGDCKSKLCGSSTVLTTVIAPTATGPICTTPCCSSADCPTSFVCFNGGTGGSYCVPARTAGRTPGATAGGGKMAGATCTTASECRSGYCGTANSESGYSVCIDTCCAANECATGTICRLANIAAPPPAHTVWICAPPLSSATIAPGDNFQGCSANAQCTTNACTNANCRPPCASSATCATVNNYAGGVCIHGTVGTETEPFCLKGTSAGPDPAGAACVNQSTCSTGYCDQELAVCKNVCARDSDCDTGEACRPSAVGTPFLRCVTKPL